MRFIRKEASARHSTGVVGPPARVSSEDGLTALSELSCILPDISHPTSYLPSHRSGFAARPSLRSQTNRDRCYEGSDSRRSHVARRVSPLNPLCLLRHSAPNHAIRPMVAFSVVSAPSIILGFAII